MYNSDLITYYEIGMERETLRINSEGFSALTPHQFSDDPHMERDFCENQLEIITDVYTDVDNMLSEMKMRHRNAMERIRPQGEILWPMSNPAYVLPEEEIPIAEYFGEKAYKTEYRNYLSKKYGRKKMLFSGIHLNYSIPEQILEELYNSDSLLRMLYEDHLLHCKIAPDSFTHFKNFVYLYLADQVTEISWLISYLTAASPLMDMSFYGEKKGETERNKYSSYRVGPEGYWNDFTPILDYSALDKYIESIESLVDRGLIYSPSELYIPVRLKNKGESSLSGLRQNGISHIELRMFDLNPLVNESYIDERDIRFIILLLAYLLSKETDTIHMDYDGGNREEREDFTKATMRHEDDKDFAKGTAKHDEHGEFSKEAQDNAIQNMKNSVFLDEKKAVIILDKKEVPVRKAAGDYLNEMSEFFKQDAYATDLINYQKNKLNSGQSYAEIISKKYQGDFVQDILSEFR